LLAVERVREHEHDYDWKLSADWKKIKSKMPTPKIVAIMPAYNARKTLQQTVREIPAGVVQECIVVDDFSDDSTIEVARKLGLRVFLQTAASPHSLGS